VTSEGMEVMKLVQIKTMRLLQVEKRHVKNLNAENAIQNVSLFDSQTFILREKRGHGVYF
jgi:hypothetical protein